MHAAREAYWKGTGEASRNSPRVSLIPSPPKQTNNDWARVSLRNDIRPITSNKINTVNQSEGGIETQPVPSARKCFSVAVNSYGFIPP